MYSKLATTIVLFICLIPSVSAQAVQKIGDNNYTIDASAVLEIESTTKGFLPPRMTETKRGAIALPATGLTIFNTTTNALDVNTGTSSLPVWTSLLKNSLPSANILVGSAGGIATAVSPSGAVTISNTGVTAIANGAVDLTTNVTGVLPGTNGGTGVNNNGKTVTLGGNLTTIGAFATTLTATAATAVTLPVSGTLATTADVTAAKGSTAIVSTAVAYTVLATDGTILCTTPANYTITLPAPATGNVGKVYVIRKIDSTNNVLTFSPVLTTSTGSTVSSLNYVKTVRIQSDGTSWYIID